MIRFILVLGFLILYLILTIPVLIVEWIIGKFNPKLKGESCLGMVKWAFRGVVFLAGTKVIVKGEENVPKDTAVLYIGNHRSYFDVILTYIRVPRMTGYIAKKELNYVPLLNNWMRNLHCLFIDRKNIKEGMKTILAAVEKVKSGISITIFPEGTRSKTPDKMLPFKDGSFKIAERGGVPIVPMTIVNSSAVWEDQMPRMKPATVVIEYGAPIDMKAMDRETKKNIGGYVQKIIQETYDRNKAEYFS